MLIRAALASDAPAIAHLTMELGYQVDTADIEARLAILLARDSTFIAVAAMESTVVGWIAAEHRLTLESGERAEIVGLVVSAGHRRVGIGAALVRAAESWVIARGLRAINVRSNIIRAGAHPFYEGLGYVRTKTQHAYAKRLEND